ncbi:HAD family hydrolase [Kushneria sp. TE3]|uniref:HAD family hydrolase n=1 Tax=Kushneria sp. TE3 TaxID=3449832 RepID=UPI003F684B15
MRSREILLFDVGGVLADWDGTTPLVNLTGGRLSHEQARRFWLEFAPLEPFETGRASARGFLKAAVETLELDMTPETFEQHYSGWVTGLYPGTRELLERIDPRFYMAILSNNNPIHWAVIQRTGLEAHFDTIFLSHEIGYRKPDPRAWQHVIKALACSANQITFLDDNPECVDAARTLGMRAHLVNGKEALETCLESEGYLGS